MKQLTRPRRSLRRSTVHRRARTADPAVRAELAAIVDRRRAGDLAGALDPLA